MVTKKQSKLSIFINKMVCILLGHDTTTGTYMSECGNYTHDRKCNTCGTLFGLPHMTEDYIKETFLLPPKQPIVNHINPQRELLDWLAEEDYLNEYKDELDDIFDNFNNRIK